MGGRGGSSGISNAKPISPLMARVAYNAAKKSSKLNNAPPEKRDKAIEKAIKAGDGKFIDSIKTEREARRVSEYLNDRLGETQRKIVKLGSAEKLQKNPGLYNENANIVKLSNEASKKVSSLMDTSDQGRRNVEVKNTTTTYDRARKRRMKNFDSWFGRR